MLIDPRNPSHICVSCAGLWASTDTGGTWQIINHGMYNEYLPPERREDPIVQDIHLLSRCAARPEISWCQHHNGVFRSENAGANRHELTAIRPSKFGFAVAAHPRDPDTAWFVPAIKDERRVPVDGKVVVARTDIEHPVGPPATLTSLPGGIDRRPAGSVSVRVRMENRFQSGLQIPFDDLLGDSVADRRNSQRPSPSIVLWDVDPPNRRGKIAP